MFDLNQCGNDDAYQRQERRFLSFRKKTMTHRSAMARIRQLIVLGCLPWVFGCHPDETVNVGQALATVNGNDITIHQVNAELRAAPTAGNPAQMQLRALQQVIDRELLAVQAVKRKLDRDPVVLMAIERSKKQILAQAYLQDRVGSAVKPSIAEIDAYTQSHPELFANRKVYNLRYLSMPSATLDDEVAALADQVRTLDELAAQLRARKIAFGESQSYRSSAELPTQLLSNLDRLAKRPIFIMRDGGLGLLASLNFVKDAPVIGEEAKQQAEQYLSKRQSMSLAQEEISRLRQDAKIAYAKGSEPEAAGLAAARSNAETAQSAARGSKSATEGGISGLR